MRLDDIGYFYSPKVPAVLPVWASIAGEKNGLYEIHILVKHPDYFKALDEATGTLKDFFDGMGFEMIETEDEEDAS